MKLLVLCLLAIIALAQPIVDCSAYPFCDLCDDYRCLSCSWPYFTNEAGQCIKTDCSSIPKCLYCVNPSNLQCKYCDFGYSESNGVCEKINCSIANCVQCADQYTCGLCDLNFAITSDLKCQPNPS